MTINISVPYKNEYNDLKKACHSTRPAHDLSIWPDLIPDDVYQVRAYDFWILDNVLSIIGAQDKQKYTNPITLGGALIDSTPKELAPKNFQDKTKLINQHIYTPDEPSETELTQYACWALMKSMNQSTTFFQEYFMNPHASLMDVYRVSNFTTRIPLRAELATKNTQLNGILHSVGAVDPSYFATYNREKTEAFFGGKTKVNIIKNRRLAPNVNTPTYDRFATPSQTHLVDYMNARLLVAYIAAIQNIITQWDNTSRSYRNYTTLRDITYSEIKRARKAFITKYESSPEENISPYGIKTVEYDQHLRELNFAREHINSHIR